MIKFFFQFQSNWLHFQPEQIGLHYREKFLEINLAVPIGIDLALDLINLGVRRVQSALKICEEVDWRIRNERIVIRLKSSPSQNI